MRVEDTSALKLEKKKKKKKKTIGKQIISFQPRYLWPYRLRLNSFVVDTLKGLFGLTCYWLQAILIYADHNELMMTPKFTGDDFWVALWYVNVIRLISTITKNQSNAWLSLKFILNYE